MKNLGNINGKVEIMKDENTEDVSLVASSNVIKLSVDEAADLAVALNYAAFSPEVLEAKHENNSPVVSLRNLRKPNDTRRIHGAENK